MATDETMMRFAIRKGRLDVCKVLVNEIGEIYNGKTTTLHFAASYDREDICRWLVETDPTLIKKVDSSERNALHFAVKQGNLAVAKTLIQLDPSLVWQRDRNDHTPLITAINRKEFSLYSVLSETKWMEWTSLSVDWFGPPKLFAQIFGHTQIEWNDPSAMNIYKEKVRAVQGVFPVALLCL